VEILTTVLARFSRTAGNSKERLGRKQRSKRSAMSPEVRRELLGLLAALCDGELSAEQHTRLEEMLAADAGCRQLYLEYVDMHARLIVHPHFGGGALPPPPAESAAATALRATPAPSPVSRVFRYVLVAAGTLAASLLLQLYFWWHFPVPDRSRPAVPVVTETRPAGYVATLTQTAGCIWENPKEPLRDGARLLPSELRLRKGLARVRFDSGPDLLVEGPAALRIDSGTSATVLRGKVVFRADETAPPFDLHTPSSTLVDLGTEYAVSVGPEGEEIHVFDGEVRRTPRAAGEHVSEHLKTGEARRYGPSPEAVGQPTPLDPTRFVRRVAEPEHAPAEAGLIAYEGFDYPDPDVFRLGKATGGTGWTSPWTRGFARPLLEGDRNFLAINPKRNLVRSGSALPSVGGSFDYLGFAKYWRRLATPVRLDTDGVYYLSFLFRREGPPADPLNAVAVLLRTTDELKTEDSRFRLNVGVGGANELFTHLQRVGSRTPVPLSYGKTYLLVAKIAASAANADQVFMRVYGAADPIDRDEPGSWTVIGPQFHSDLVFDWLEVHINSKTRQTIDEIRLGTTWESVAAPWINKERVKEQ
jgi:ferric-dicitrate binding protein FerR (iron transport regulator)